MKRYTFIIGLCIVFTAQTTFEKLRHFKKNEKEKICLPPLKWVVPYTINIRTTKQGDLPSVKKTLKSKPVKKYDTRREYANFFKSMNPHEHELLKEKLKEYFNF